MIVRKLRLQRGWSQEKLADLTGLSTRTIQRIERGHKPGLESQKLLSDAFEIDIATLQEGLTMHNDKTLNTEEERAIAYVRDLKGFYSHAIKYTIIVTGLFLFNLIKSPEHMWVYWVMFGWGIGLVVHALNVFEVFHFFSPDWEKRQIERRLRKSL
jgi:transcriptional regulator with XRE-family HTH domain